MSRAVAVVLTLAFLATPLAVDEVIP